MSLLVLFTGAGAGGPVASTIRRPIRIPVQRYKDPFWGTSKELGTAIPPDVFSCICRTIRVVDQPHSARKQVKQPVRLNVAHLISPKQNNFKFRSISGISARKDYGRTPHRFDIIDRVVTSNIPRTDPFHIRTVSDITRARLPVGDRGTLRHGTASITDTPKTDQFKFRIIKGDGPRHDHGRLVNRTDVVDRTPFTYPPRQDPFKFRYASGISNRKDYARIIIRRGCVEKFVPPVDYGVFGHAKIRQIPGASNRKDYARVAKRTEVAENFTVLHQPRIDVKAPSPRILLSKSRGSFRRAIPRPPGVPWQAPYTPRRLSGGLPVQLKREISWGGHRFGPGAKEIKTYIPLDFSRLLIEVGYETQATIDMTYPITVYVTVDHPDDVTMDLDIAV